MTKGLKRCPFCNQEASVLTEREDYRVVCGYCAASTGCFETAKEAVASWNARNEHEGRLERTIVELSQKNMALRSMYINKDNDLIFKVEISAPNRRNDFPFCTAYNFDNIRDLNDVEKDVLSKLLTDAKKELCDGVPYESCSYSCRACESVQHEREDELHGKIGKLESENKRLREALEEIKQLVAAKDINHPVTVYDVAEIYAECCDALEGKDKNET